MTIQKALRALIIVFACVFSEYVSAQQGGEVKYYTDTVKLSLADAEQRFVDQSLAVVASKYDVDIAKSNILQTRLWYNPNIFYSQTLYNSVTKKYFDASPPSGNYDVQVNQLFSIAGKHTNAVKLAKIDAERAGYIFNEVVRSLKLELYTNYIGLLTGEQKMRLFDSQIQNLQHLLSAAEQQFKLGAIAGNEVIRLRAELQDIKNAAISNETEILDAQAVLKTLLNYDLPVFLVVSGPIPPLNQIPSLGEVLGVAEQNRSDLQLAAKDMDFAKQNLKYQHSVAVPDMTVGTEFDRAGNASPNFYGVNVGMGLPVFNRNQGQIAIARYQIKRSETNQAYVQNTVRNQVESAYVKLLKVKNQLDNLDPNYNNDLEKLIQYAVNNYNKRYISLLEFLDQLRTYTSARLSLIDLNADYYTAIQNINYSIGTNYIK